jgi:hypothetical protein
MGREDATRTSSSPGTPGLALSAACNEALNSYPQDGRFVGLILRYAGLRYSADSGILSGPLNDATPETRDAFIALIQRALYLVPAFISSDPGLAVYAAPLMADRDAAARTLSSYRALPSTPVPESIPEALVLKLISPSQAVSELFAASPLHWGLLTRLWPLVEGDAAAAGAFRRDLLAYSGVIIEDSDRVGWPESEASFSDGGLSSYRYDYLQDGIIDWEITCAGGIPSSGTIILADGSKTLFRWALYPELSDAAIGTTIYRFMPRDFSLQPLLLSGFFGAGREAFIYPLRGALDATESSLLYAAAEIERPGANFPGSVQRITVLDGIPTDAAEYVNGSLAATTVYSGGLPVSERLDLDLDGVMESYRVYDINGNVVFAESDWN